MCVLQRVDVGSDVDTETPFIEDDEMKSSSIEGYYCLMHAGSVSMLDIEVIEENRMTVPEIEPEEHEHRLVEVTHVSYDVIMLC